MYSRVKNKKKEKLFYIGDIVAGIILVAIVVASIIMATRPSGNIVEIYVDGQLTYSYDLSIDRVIEVEGDYHNIVVIKDGKVFVSDADCGNKTCVKSREISNIGEQITCLPNKVVIVIRGDKEGELDATT